MWNTKVHGTGWSTSTLTPGVPRIRLFLGVNSQRTPRAPVLISAAEAAGRRTHSSKQEWSLGEALPTAQPWVTGDTVLFSPLWALVTPAHLLEQPQAFHVGPIHTSQCRVQSVPVLPIVQHLLSNPASLIQSPHTHTSGTNTEPGSHLNPHQHHWLGQSCAINPQKGLEGTKCP